MNVLRRIPILPSLISLAVILSSAVAANPVFDAATGADVVDAFIDRPLAYVVLAPLSDILDTITLLGAGQHIALLLTAIAGFVIWRSLNARAGLKRHAIATAAFFGAIVLTYAAVALLPRPMASLSSNNDAVVKIDFHSHTAASHDGHQSVEALREWHRKAGFDVAYVTDHANVSGVERGLAVNANPVAGNVTVLQSIETSWSGEHVSIPNAERAYKGILTATLADVDTQGLRLASFVPGREPVVIWNHPRNLGALPPSTGPGTIGVRAIEIVNGAPKDAARLRANRKAIVEMAQGGGVALTSGSDNHGYGRATPGWTIMMIVGWRAASPDALGLKIEQGIREGAFRATRVVERRVADPGTSLPLLAASVFTVPWTMLKTTSNDERGWWLVWTWLIWGVARYTRRKRQAA